jgi:hypothetical protein
MTIFEIFDSNSDKARLVTTLISTIVALFVVYAAHRLTHKRDRVSFKSKKIEEAYNSLRKMRAHGVTIMRNHISEQPAEDSVHDGYRDSMETLELIAYLYIPSIEEYVKEMNEIMDKCRRREAFEFKSSFYPEHNSYIAYFLTQAMHCRLELKNQIQKVT